MADETMRKPGPDESLGGYGGSRMPGRNAEDEQAATDMGGQREGMGAQGDAADRAEVDRPDLNNQDVE